MLKNRVIPIVLLRNGVLVQSKGFKRYQALGSPTAIVARLSNWFSDELIYLDISREQNYDLRRDDLNFANRNSILDILSDVASKCFMPLTFGGGIRTISDVYDRLVRGADKVSINSQAHHQPELISECAKKFGAQCVVVSVDAKSKEGGGWEVFVDGGRTPTGKEPGEYAREAQERGAGEIIIGSIDRDGSGTGYDIPLFEQVLSKVKVPVIGLGGVGNWEHLQEGLGIGLSAVAAANIFSYSENSVYNAKSFLFEKGLNVREPLVESVT